MSENTMTLNMLPIGARAIVSDLQSESRMKRRLMDLGLIPDTVVEALFKSPSGDPTAYSIRGAVIALRCEDSASIFLKG